MDILYIIVEAVSNPLLLQIILDQMNIFAIVSFLLMWIYLWNEFLEV